MPTTTLMPVPKQNYQTALGTPLVGGKVYTYAAGTNNPKATYTDAAGTTPHQNPITLNLRGEPPAPIFWTGNYRVEVRDALNNLIYSVDNYNTDPAGVWDAMTRMAAAAGASLVGFQQSGAGAVVNTVQSKLREVVSLADFGVVGDGTDESAKFQKAVTASAGKTLRGDGSKTYLLRDMITFPSNIVLDMQGAQITDDVQGYWPATDAGRAKPMFFIYGVKNVVVKNIKYSAAGTRAKLTDDVPTAIIWIGDNRGGALPTNHIGVQNIEAANCVASTLFVSITGNAFNIEVKDVDIQGNCSYGINIEYGLAPTDTDRYGLHPYNITVDRFTGSDNTTCVGFLRVASCYNIKFSNCFGKDVRSFIYAWAGDRGISRMSENVLFENCSHYASANFLPGVINYVVQVLAVSQDGSTGVPLPSWTNYDHLFQFRGCQFQNNKVQYSTSVRYYGTQGIALFESCILQGSHYGALAQPTASVSYTSSGALVFRDCVFKGNTQDIVCNAVRSVLVDHCQFKNPDGTAIPVSFIGSVYYSKILNCNFAGMPTDIAWVSIAAGCDYNEISGNVFEDSGGAGSAPPLELLSPTFGLGNSNRYSDQGMTKQGANYYGVLGEPSTMEFDMAGLVGTAVDCRKRRSYIALTGGVQATIDSILNGNIGDVVVFRSASPIASVTFKDNAAVGTLSRLLTPATGDLVKTGSRWTITAHLTAVGWLLS